MNFKGTYSFLFLLKFEFIRYLKIYCYARLNDNSICYNYVFLLLYLGILLCLLAVSIPIDAAKKKLLKKLAKELGYKLEEAIFKNIGDKVDQVCLSIVLQNTNSLLK